MTMAIEMSSQVVFINIFDRSHTVQWATGCSRNGLNGQAFRHVYFISMFLIKLKILFLCLCYNNFAYIFIFLTVTHEK